MKRLSQNQIDYIAFSVYKMLQNHPKVDVRNADAIVSIVRQEIIANLKAEAEIEQEAEQKLAPHKAQILQEGADYHAMLRQGMQTIAKKKGIVL